MTSRDYSVRYLRRKHRKASDYAAHEYCQIKHKELLLTNIAAINSGTAIYCI